MLPKRRAYRVKYDYLDATDENILSVREGQIIVRLEIEEDLWPGWILMR